MRQWYVLASAFPVLTACLSSSANVLICCLVQPDGLLPSQGEDGGDVRGGRRGSYLQRFPLIKKPSAKITHRTLSPSIPLSEDNHTVFLRET